MKYSYATTFGEYRTAGIGYDNHPIRARADDPIEPSKEDWEPIKHEWELISTAAA